METNRMKMVEEQLMNLQPHGVDGIQHPAHRAVAPAHQHAHAARGEERAQLQGLGGGQPRQVEHLQESHGGEGSRVIPDLCADAGGSRGTQFWTDLDRIQEGPKLPQEHLPHVVAATGVGQDQNRRPAAPAGRRQLHRHGKSCVNGAALGPAPLEAPPGTLAYSSGCRRRSLLTR